MVLVSSENALHMERLLLLVKGLHSYMQKNKCLYLPISITYMVANIMMPGETLQCKYVDIQLRNFLMFAMVSPMKYLSTPYRIDYINSLFNRNNK